MNTPNTPGGTIDTPDTSVRPRHVSLQLPEPLMLAARLTIVAIVVAALYVGKDILVPLALAALLAFVLDPLVARLRRWQLPRGLAVAIVTLCALATIAGASLLVGQQVVQLGKDLPQYQSTVENKLRALRQRIAGDRSLHSASRLIDSVGQEVDATRKALEASSTGPSAQSERALPVQVTAAKVSPMKALHDGLTPVLEPLLTGGIAVVLLIFMLLERHDLRDRVMRLVGGNLHTMTDALNEAAQRVSRYLSMQVVVNVGYGVPLTLGLWWIGVPGAVLWGLLAATLRFVPYLGPVVASIFPLVLAFAVDPGWDMLLWTAALVLTLELISNNLIEPWLYGGSTGLAPVAILLSAAFWTLLWGTVGLILATPLTVCLVVLGRHLPQLAFLDLMLGSEPVFDAPTRLYQRLLSGSVAEASDLAESAIVDDGLATFYSATALPALGMAAADHIRVASAEHRHRVATGMADLLRELRQDHPAAALPADAQPAVLCLGLRWEADALACDMLAHALAFDGVAARALPAVSISAERLANLDIDPQTVVFLSTFHPDPGPMARHACRRLHRLHPGLPIVLGLWHAPPALREPGVAAALGATAVATSLSEALEHTRALCDPGAGAAAVAAPAAEASVVDVETRSLCQQLDLLRAAPAMQTAQRAAEVFGTEHGVVWWADERVQSWHADPKDHSVELGAVRDLVMQPRLLDAQSVVVPDAAREPQLSTAAGQDGMPHRFIAAVPLRWHGDRTLGVLCVLDAKPRTFDTREQGLLEGLAAELMQRLQTDVDLLATASKSTPELPRSPGVLAPT